MSIIYRADLRPGKLELLQEWLPRQPWYAASGDSPLVAMGAYRFDDPAGVVGLETHLVRAGDGAVLQVPVTYRPAPLASAEEALIGIMEHSVLGTRWVYDALHDPTYNAALGTALGRGPAQAEEWVVSEGRNRVLRVPSVRVTVQGDPTPGEPELRRVLDPAEEIAGRVLCGTWAGQPDPVVLAAVSV